MINNYNDFNTEKISFTNIEKYNEYTFNFIKYQEKNLYLNMKAVEFYKCVFSSQKNIYILKFKINAQLQNILQNIEIKCKSFIFKNKNQIFSNLYDNNQIDQLYFSNIEKKNDFLIINIKLNSLDEIKNSNLNLVENKKYNLGVHIKGLWFMENLYGISYDFYNLKDT